MAERIELPTEQCGTCRFWDDQHHPTHAETGDHGTCRRFPPTLNSRSVKLNEDEEEYGFAAATEAAAQEPLCWQQPVTLSDDWCGEWQAGEGQRT